MSDEEQKRKEENRRKFEEESRRRIHMLSQIMSRGGARHMEQTLYTRPPGPQSTSRSDLNSLPQPQSSSSQSRPSQVSRIRTSPESDDSPVFQEFGEEEPPPRRQRQRHPAGDRRVDDLAQSLGSGLTLGANQMSPNVEQTEPSVRPKVRTTPPNAGSSGQIGSTSSSGMSSLQQTEPSVRPKVRPSPPPYPNTIPDPEIVRRLRDPQTGEPDLRKIRYSQPFVPSHEREPALKLANISRIQIDQIRTHDKTKADRMSKYLWKDRGYRYEIVDKDKNKDNPTYRYYPQRNLDDIPSGERPRLQPSRKHDFLNRFDPRFNKPIKAQDNKTRTSSVGPVGRQSYGPSMRRAMSLPDLRSEAEFDDEPPTPLEEYSERYRRLPEEEQNTYDDFRSNISWDPNSRKRMVKQPNLMAIADSDSKRVNEIRSRLGKTIRPVHDQREAQLSKRNRRKYIAERTKLPRAFTEKEKKKHEWLQQGAREPIPEADEESDSEEE